MEKPPELLKSFANRLAKIALSEDGSNTTRLMRFTGFMGATPDVAPEPSLTDNFGGREAGDNSAASARTPARVGIWERKEENGQVYFARTMDTITEWNYWANIGRIEPKGAKRRIVFIGESVGRGFLYDPQFTPAMALETILKSRLGDGEVEIIDLARTNLGFEVKELAKAALMLEPDIVVFYCGNNWEVVAKLGTERVPYLEGIVQEEGVPGLKRFIKEVLTTEAKRVVSEVGALYKSRGVPAIWLVPEFNLADWRDPITNAPHLAGDANREWVPLRKGAEEALRDGDLKLAAELAGKMVELDEGVCVLGLYILAECSQRSGDIEAARRYFETARDAANWDTSRNIAPRPYAVTQETLRAEVPKHGGDLVDMPKIFKEYLNGELPDRRLFLDYCHLTSEGIIVSMAATASRILHALNGTDVHWRSLVDERLGPSKEIEAEASFLAAVHNGHWWQTAELVQHYCDRAVQAWPGIAQVMTRFIDLQTRRAPMLMCRSAEQIGGLGSPLIQHYLLRYNNQQLDQLLLDAVIASLGKLGIEAGERLKEIRREEHSVTWRNTNLLEYYYCSAALQPQEVLWVMPRYENDTVPKLSQYYKAYWLESRFVFIGEAKCPVQLRLTCRLPGELSLAEGRITLEVNGERIGEAVVGQQWTTLEALAGSRLVRDGINEVLIRWPMPDFPGLKGLEPILDDVMESYWPEFFCVFGEVHTFVATDGRAAQPNAPQVRRESLAAEVV